MTIKLPPSLREACLRPRLPEGDAVTVGALASFSVEQEAALAVCDARRAAIAAIVDAHAQAVTPSEKRGLFQRLRARF